MQEYTVVSHSRLLDQEIVVNAVLGSRKNKHGGGGGGGGCQPLAAAVTAASRLTEVWLALLAMRLAFALTTSTVVVCELCWFHKCHVGCAFVAA